MKNTVRRLLAIVLSALVAFAPLSASAYSENPGAPYAHLMAVSGVYAVDEHNTYSIAPFSPEKGVYTLLFLEFATGSGTFLQDAGDGSYQGSADPTGKGPIHWRIKPTLQDGTISGVQIWEQGRTGWRSAKRVPLRAEEISFRNGDVDLVGTYLRRADRIGKVPSVVLAHGSGHADRAHFPGMPHFLANLGFGVFFFDKRGSGYSTGDFAQADFEALSGDLVAALNTVANRADGDKTQIGMLGASQGPWLMFKAARKTPLVRFVISLWGTPYSVGEQGVYDLIKELEAQGVDDWRSLHEAAAMQRRVNTYLTTGANWAQVEQQANRLRERPWFALSSFDGLDPDMKNGNYARYVGYDPADDIRAFQGPVLYLVGEYDQKVDPKNSVALMRSLLDQGNNPDYATHLMARSHHGMLYQPGRFSHDQFEGVTGFHPEFWNVLELWLRQRVGVTAPPRH